MPVEGNTADNWRIFETDYDIHIEVGCEDKSEGFKAYMLLKLAGP